jgi:mono/diheme cytochrome c family protein
MHTDWKRIVLVAAAALAGLLGAPGATRAESEKTRSLELKMGQEQYMRYCSTCHGPKAEGDGVASHLFTKKPPNLTLLAKNNGGEFPMNEVLGIVKGDAPIAAHGKREMPLWGEIIGRPEQETMDSQAVADSEIMTIATYLKSIQQK